MREKEKAIRLGHCVTNFIIVLHHIAITNLLDPQVICRWFSL